MGLQRTRELQQDIYSMTPDRTIVNPLLQEHPYLKTLYNAPISRTLSAYDTHTGSYTRVNTGYRQTEIAVLER